MEPTIVKVDYGLVAAVVGAVIALLIIGTLAYTQRIVDVTTYLTPLAGSIATILSAIFVTIFARRGFGTVRIIITTIIATSVFAIAVLAGVWWLQTEQGRSAARTASGWRLLYRNTFPDAPCSTNTEDAYGSGKACSSDSAITVWLNSNKSAVQPALDSTPATGSQWYAQIDMRMLQGPPDAICLLMFGYRDENHWYALRVQGEQPGSQGGSVGVSEFEGTEPARFYFGPVVERTIDLGSWTSAAIKADGDSYDFFINNHPVARDLKINGVQGSINIGTLAPASFYRTTEACQFRNLIVRQR